MYKDPIEETEEYKKIESELEKELDARFKDTPRGLGFCHVYWHAKKKLLKEKYNIDWKSPSELNPFIIFD